MTLLPAGRKFCKITQNRPNKKMIGRENLAAVRPPILDKSGRKAAEKILYEKYEFSLDLLACVSNCHQNFF
jgi:hypothetical protein